MRVAAWRATWCNHSQAGMHSASFQSHLKGLFCQQGHMLYIQYRIICNVYMMTLAENCLLGVPGDGISVSLSCHGERSINDSLVYQINNTLLVKVSRLHYGPFLKPCDVILLCCTDTLTDWQENGCTVDSDIGIDQMMVPNIKHQSLTFIFLMLQN